MLVTPEDKQHLMNIADAIEEIQSYVQYNDYNMFAKDEMTRESVARLFQDIGGAAKMLSDDFKDNFGDIDWNVLIRLEDAMYDQAEETSFEAIWSIIKNDLPEIKSQVTDLAANLREEDDIQGFDLTEDPMTH
ncbi:MAG: HepT-like ribonuclease domain-containing protein [Bacteroidia bacterium]